MQNTYKKVLSGKTMTRKLVPGYSKKSSRGQSDLIEKFKTTYNAIDHHLRKTLRKGKQVPFSGLVNEYEHTTKLFRVEADWLRVAGALRNVLIHERTRPYDYPAIPTPVMVGRMEKILERLINPLLAIPTFQKEVETVSVKDSLSNVLRKISYKEYSQFPVYDDERFKGLLTENGITRWLAHHVLNELSLIELQEILVEDVLRNEETRENCIFVQRDKKVDEIRNLFAEKELLEAVLITEGGNEKEELKGIATRWDMLTLK